MMDSAAFIGVIVLVIVLWRSSVKRRRERDQDQSLWRELASRISAIEHELQKLQTEHPGKAPEKSMVRGVARWQAQERDDAMQNFNGAIANLPAWGNEKWVKSLYSPLVVQSVEEMKQERKRREQKARETAAQFGPRN